METKYKIFDKGFNKILDLIEEANSQAVDAYKCLVEILPDEVIEETEKCEEFSDSNQFYTVDLCNTGNTLHFDFARNYNFLRVMVKIHRIFEKELEENDSIELFELILRNYFQKNSDKECFEYKCNINLKLIGYDYYLIKQEVVENKTYLTKTLVSYDDIQRCFETEEEYVPDLEFEINPDFDL